MMMRRIMGGEGWMAIGRAFAILALLAFALVVGAACVGDSEDVDTPEPSPIPPPVESPEPAPGSGQENLVADIDLGMGTPHWFRPRAPYTCITPEKETSPWIEAGMADLGGADALSLVRWHGNDSHIPWTFMTYNGCTRTTSDPEKTYLDAPIDPTYYSLGDLVISVDIARVPVGKGGWFNDDGARESMSMEEAVATLNEYVAAYYRRISSGKLRFSFAPGSDFVVEGDGSHDTAKKQQLRLAGIRDCAEGDTRALCTLSEPAGIHRILLVDVTAYSAGQGFAGSADFGLVSVSQASMQVLVHEIGHGWMNWPHSFTEIGWKPKGVDDGLEPPNPYSNHLDVMSALTLPPVKGWSDKMPATMAINRYSAGWIDPSDVALHLAYEGVYTLQPPLQDGYQLLVISSGRPHAFTTVEVLDERDDIYIDDSPIVYDPDAPDGLRPFRYSGALISRYDQSAGTGTQTRLGPALYDIRNPDVNEAVGWGRDDYSVLHDGESREIGGGVTVGVSENADGSYEIAVRGGRIAPFTRWCYKLWFSSTGDYDTGCALAGELNGR